MLKTYLKIACRNLWNNRGFSAINILGLAIGISTFIVISFYVLDELSYDRHHKNADRIFRLTYEKEGNEPWLKDVPAVVEGIARQVPEIETYARLFPASGLVKAGNAAFNESNILFSDPSIINIFSLQFVLGNPAQSLDDPGSVVITETISKKYFGEKNPLGQQLNLTGNDGLSDFVLTVTAIIKDIPQNSHFHFGFLIPYQFQLATQSNTGVYSYLLLSRGAHPARVSEKINIFQRNYYNEWKIDSATKINLQPLTSIHLHSHFFEEIEPNSSPQHIYIFSVAAFLVLFIACINYINITLARSTKRAKEVGIRKVLGASKLKVILQFIIESFVSLLLALAISMLIIQSALPVFNSFTGTSLEPDRRIILLIPFIMFLCLLSVLYPALILSDFKPVLVLKNIIPTAALKTTTLRKALLFFQFFVSIVLVICTVAVYQQLAYIQNKHLGFNKDQVLVIHLRNPEMQELYPILKTELMKIAAVVKVAASHTVPGEEFTGSIYRMPVKTGINDPGTETFPSNTLFVDEDYFDLMELRLLAGRKFSEKFNQSDVHNALIINESAVKEVGFRSSNEAIGKIIEYFVPEIRAFRAAKVVGVINDFHYESLHNKIEPLMLRLAQPGSTSIRRDFTETITTLSIKIKATDISHTIEQIKNSWQKLDKAYPFEYAFLDEKMTKLYNREQKLSHVFSYFSFIALLLTFTGLFGVSLLTIGQRAKEVSIRKVLGASVRDIVRMLSKDFLKIVFVSALIATPVAWVGMQQWLQDFAYRINLSWWIFASSIGVALFITLITVSFQSIKAGLENPVKSLRTE